MSRPVSLLPLLLLVVFSAAAQVRVDEPAIIPNQLHNYEHGFEKAFAAATDGDVIYALSASRQTRIAGDGAILDAVSRPFPMPRVGVAAYGAGVIAVARQFGGERSVSGSTSTGELLWTIPDLGGNEIVFDGRNFVVAELYHPYEAVEVTLVSPRGEIVNRTRIAKTAGAQLGYTDERVAGIRTDAGVALVWPERDDKATRRTLVLAMIGSDGQVASKSVIGTAAQTHSMAIASAGENILLFAEVGHNWTEVDLQVTVVEVGQVRTSTVLRRPANPGALAAVWDRGRYRLAWHQEGKVWVAAVDEDGAVLEQPRAVVTGTFPKLIATTSGVSLLFVDRTFFAVRTITSSEGSRAFEEKPQAYVSTRVATETNPVVVWTGDRYLAVWAREAELWEIRSRTFDAAGHPLTPPVTIARNLYQWPTLSLATNGRVAVVAVGANWTTLIVRLTATGELIDQRNIEASYDFKVASNGDGFLEVHNSQGFGITARRLDSQGGVIDAALFPIVDYDHGVWGATVSVVPFGGDYAVTYDSVNPATYCPARVCDGFAYISRVYASTGRVGGTRRVHDGRGTWLGSNGSATLTVYDRSAALLTGGLHTRPPLILDGIASHLPVDIVWNGSSWLLLNGQHVFELDAEARRLLRTVTLPHTVRAAAAGDGRGNALFLQLDPNGRIHARVD